MLLKLLKHEFRCTRRIMLPILIGVLGLGVMAGVSMRVIEGTHELNFLLKTLLDLIQVGFYLSVFAAVVAAVILMVYRFYKNLMGDEGYISMTLPVTVDGHIWNKLISSTVWLIAAIGVCIASLLLMLAISGQKVDFSQLDQLITFANMELGVGNVAVFIAEFFLFVILATFAGNLHFYCAMAIGCSANSSKKFLSVVAYFGIDIARNVLSVSSLAFLGSKAVMNRIDLALSFETARELLPFVHSLMGVALLAILLAGCVLYLVTRIFMKKKLNLA